MLHALIVKITDNHMRKDVKWRGDLSGHSCEIHKCVVHFLVLERSVLIKPFYHASAELRHVFNTLVVVRSKLGWVEI